MTEVDIRENIYDYLETNSGLDSAIVRLGVEISLVGRSLFITVANKLIYEDLERDIRQFLPEYIKIYISRKDTYYPASIVTWKEVSF